MLEESHMRGLRGSGGRGEELALGRLIEVDVWLGDAGIDPQDRGD